MQPWRAKRLLWNVFSFTREQERALEKENLKLEVDTGDYDPLLGYSFGEIAGMSRSMHRSQGMGAPQRKGSMPQFFRVVAGEPASRDPFDGIDTTWKRMPGGEAVEQLLAKASREFQPEHPDKLIPILLQARPLIAAIKEPAAQEKLKELDNTIALCAGLWLDAAADRPDAIPGGKLQLTVTALNRSAEKVSLQQVQWTGAADGDGPRRLPLPSRCPTMNPSRSRWTGISRRANRTPSHTGFNCRRRATPTQFRISN